MSMRDVPRWLKVTAITAGIAFMFALAKPATAGLILRAYAIGVVIAVAIAVVAGALHGLAPADGVGRRADRREPADLPAELGNIVEALRTVRRRDPLPLTVLRPLRIAFVSRLWTRHGLSVAIPDDDEAIRARVSPTAYQLLQAAQPTAEPVVIRGSELPALIEEVEHL